MEGTPVVRQRILVVDDDPKIVNLVRAYLVAAGFDVITAGDGPTALDKAATFRPRLLVLDLMLPGLDGLEVSRRLRESSSVPILMLTARGSVAERIRGLAAGADDYLVKPFSPAELVARVEAILRRVAEEPEEMLIHHRDLEVDVARHEVRRDGHRVDLSSLEFSMLVAILMARGRVLSRDQLTESIGAADSDLVLGRSVDVYVFRLRQKLGDSADRPKYIQTVRGVGYRSVPA